VTITLTVGDQSATMEMTVVAPNTISMTYASSDTLTPGIAGVCMWTNITVGPMTVCFGNTELLEVEGAATGISGYFRDNFAAADLYHHPSPRWFPWNDLNTGLNDHAAAHKVEPLPYAMGAFHWSVPNMYRVAGTTGAGTRFTTTTQQFNMTDTLGTMTVSKAGASASRTP